LQISLSRVPYSLDLFTMTNTPSESRLPDGRRRRIDAPFYPVTWEQAVQDYEDGILTPRGLIYCYFVTHLKPGTEIQVDVDELCGLLRLGTATYYRAVGALKGKGRLNIRRGQMRVGIPVISSLSAHSQSRESDYQSRESDYQSRESDYQSRESDYQSRESGNSPKPIQDKAFLSCENVPNRSNKYLKEQQTVPPTHPVQEADINREGIGTEVDPLTADIQSLCIQIQAAGIQPNKTIQATLYTLLMNSDSASATRAVRNAISALQEQQSKGTVKNPGGFLNAALRRNFTANQAKVEARHRHQEPDHPQPPALNQVSIAVDIAIEQHRDRGIEILQDLWQQGWHDQVEELLLLRQDWGFLLTQGGVRDAAS